MSNGPAFDVKREKSIFDWYPRFQVWYATIGIAYFLLTAALVVAESVGENQKLLVVLWLLDGAALWRFWRLEIGYDRLHHFGGVQKQVYAQRLLNEHPTLAVLAAVRSRLIFAAVIALLGRTIVHYLSFLG